MIDRFLHYLNDHAPYPKGEKVLLAVSGGMDSMVLCDLLLKTGLPFEVAHCNFQLRGEESEEDARFVAGYAQQHGLVYHTATFATQAHAKKHQISLQMAARELRYEWLEATRKANSCLYIATAHHLNDAIETVWLNLAKGTGISGLHGILPKQGRLIRPLLFAAREEIEQYVKTNKIAFREDSSNESVKYQRNLIRHQLLPVLKELNPSLEATMMANLQHFREAEILYQEAVERYKRKMLQLKGQDWFIPIIPLQQHAATLTLLYELLKDFQFNATQLQQIVQALDGEPGKLFHSKTHQLLKDRKFLIISPLDNPLPDRVVIQAGQQTVHAGDLKFRIKEVTAKHFKIPDDPNKACLDLAKVKFPMTLRRWQKGDYFYPLGLFKKGKRGQPPPTVQKVGKKKVSDYYTDVKLPRTEKDRAWVLQSGDRIAWLVGQRIDDRFKIRPSTKKVLILEKID